MALSDRKIPIIAGRNDTPTTSETEANHPNGSFLISKYNALIDDIDVPLNYNTIQAFPATIFVNATTGNDTTGNGTEALPFATIQKAIDKACADKIVYADINITGTFVNPKIDCSNFYALLSIVYSDGFRPDETFWKNAGLYIDGNLIDSKIVWDTTVDQVNWAETNMPYSLIYSPHNAINIWHTAFELKGADSNIFQNSNIHFLECTFTSVPNNVDNWSDGFLQFFNCNVKFSSCSFTYSTDNYFNVINAFNSIIQIDWGITVANGDTSISLLSANNSTLNIKSYPPTTNLRQLQRNLVYIEYMAGDNATTLSLNESCNIVKAYA